MKVGRTDVHRMLREMSSVEWLQWKIFMTLNPFHRDQERADIRAARIAMTIWNAAMATCPYIKSPQFRKIEEFLTKWGDSTLIKDFSQRRSEKDAWDDLHKYAEAVGRAENQ